MSADASFAEYFREGSIRTGAQAARKEDVVALLVDAAVAGGTLPAALRAKVHDAVLEREKLGSTGIGGGVGVPHVKVDGVQDLVTAVVVCATKVAYDAVDGERCDVFFLLVSPKGQDKRHLEVLRWVSRLVRNADFARFLRAAKSPAEVLSLLREMGE